MASVATRSLVARWLPVALFALAAASGALFLALREPVAPQPPAPMPAIAQAPTPTPAPAPASPAPSFDVVRVAPDGSAVIAGRAAPGAEVTVREGGKDLGHARADQQGAFVIVPTEKLPPGAAELTLSARPPNGGAEQAGAGAVVLAVPARQGSTPPLAVLVGPGASRALQAPGTAPAGHLGLSALDYDQHGAAQFTGTARPGAHVRVYVDNHPAGDAPAGADGRWTLTPATPLAAGQHRLRLAQLGADGRVAGRVELPFLREDLAGRDIPPGSVMVQPGESLWRIARASYGSGVRYVVIFQANRGQIRNPALIYPGQVFSIPSRPLESKR
jgi:nucleoid-associated protein YgaU